MNLVNRFQYFAYLFFFLLFSFCLCKPELGHFSNKKGLDYLYNFLNENGLRKMCTILRNSFLDNFLTNFEYTLLVPTDEAFSLIPADIKLKLLNDTEFRQTFIKNHIINGRLFLNSLSNGQQIIINSASDNKIHIAAYLNGFVLNGAQLLVSDVVINKSPNIIQIIDKPVYLEDKKDLIEILNKKYKKMLRFIEISGLQKEILNDNEKTIFIPNDDAFRSLPWTITEQMYNNNTFLKNILRSHVINGIHYSLGFHVQNSTYTLSGSILEFKNKKLQMRNLIFVNDVPIINSDILFKNGLAHEISRIILPKDILDECNCIESSTQLYYDNSNLETNNKIDSNEASNSESIEDVYYKNSQENLDPTLKNNFPYNLNSLNGHKNKSTIISESVKNKYRNKENIKYLPRQSLNILTKSPAINVSTNILKPKVFYVENDPAIHTFTTLKTPLIYNENHNYHNPKYDHGRKDNQENPIANSANSQPIYSMNQNLLDQHIFSSHLPYMPLFNPFIPIYNESSINSNNILYPTLTNYTSPMSYLSHIYHGDPAHIRELINNNFQPPSYYNMKKTTAWYNSSDSLINKATKNSKNYNRNKLFNDMTTPAPYYFEPTRRPRTLNQSNKLSKTNQKTISNKNLNQNQSSRQFETSSSSIVQKPVDTKSYQVLVPPRLNPALIRKRIQFNENLRNKAAAFVNNNIKLYDVLINPSLTINQNVISFSIFETLLKQSNLISLLKGNGHLTVFFPTNKAFERINNFEKELLSIKRNNSFSNHFSRAKRQIQLLNENIAKQQFIKNLLLNHISPIIVKPSSININFTIESYSNFPIKLAKKGSKLYANDLRILASTEVSNGIAYVIDGLFFKSDSLYNNDLFSLDSNSKLKPNQSTIDIIKPDIVQVINSLPEISFFASLFRRTNYGKTPDNILTVLAPLNRAFSNIPIDFLQKLRTSDEFVNKFVSIHLVNANVSVENFIDLVTVTSIGSQLLKVENHNGMTVLNKFLTFKKTNIPSNNGFVHVISDILLPESQFEENQFKRRPIVPSEEPTVEEQISEIAKSQNSFEFFRNVFIPNLFDNMHKINHNLTLILPSDNAFLALPDKIKQKIESDAISRENLLNYHLVNDLINFNNLENNDLIKSKNGLLIFYSNITANQEKLALLKEDKKLKTYSDADNGYKPPYDMIHDQVKSFSKSDKINQFTLKDQSQISLSGAIVNRVKLIDLNQLGDSNDINKYLQLVLVDRVLYPPKGTIYELVSGSPLLSILKQLIDVANLKYEFNDLELKTFRLTMDKKSLPGITFFAPTNTAFENLGLDIIEQLKKNTETCRAFLLRHVIRNVLFTSAISKNGMTIENFSKEHLQINKSLGVVSVEGVTIEYADITAQNGVVHVIDNVL